MKTWEMIKKLTENPHKEFVRRDGLVVRINKYMELTWESGYSHLRIDDEWQEVKKAVDFMTAVKSDKRIWFPDISEEEEYLPLDVFLGEIASNCYAREIVAIVTDGKFYIEN